MQICLLNGAEVARFENWGIWPTCAHHIHLKQHEAEKLVKDDDARWVGGSDTHVPGKVSMITSTLLEGRTWKNKPCGGPQGMVVKQFISV